RVTVLSEDLLSLSFDATPAPETNTLSLHDALPIFEQGDARAAAEEMEGGPAAEGAGADDGHVRWFHAATPWVESTARGRHRRRRDRKSTRLNSSHDQISYAVFCLKKKK